MFGHPARRFAVRAHRSGLISAGLIVSMLVAAGPAAAATPTIEEVHHPASFAVADCGTFQIVGSWDFAVRIATYFDATGAAIRQEVNVHRQGTIANSVTGKSLDDSGAYAFIVDLTTGTSISPGGAIHDTAPQVGLVWLDAGLIRLDAAGNVTWAAPHANTSDAAACAYFAS